MTVAAVERPPSPIGRGTLGRRLVLQVAAIVAATALLVSMVSLTAVRQVAYGRTDAQLRDLLVRVSQAPLEDEGPRGGRLPGMPVGSFVIAREGQQSRATYLTRDGRVPVTAEAMEYCLIYARSEPKSLEVPGLGSYRVASFTGKNGATYVVALPLDDVRRTVKTMMWIEVVLALLAIGVAILVTRLVVTRALRPLRDVAGVAAEVSRRRLDRGEVDLALRVGSHAVDGQNEVGRVALALNTMLGNVEQALAARQASETKVRQFVADASHELRNPLAAIRGYAELTRRGRSDLPADTQFAMSRIESESERMSRLVEDMLLLARLDNGPDLSLSKVDLTEVVMNATADAQVAGPDHEWEVDLPEEPVAVVGDRFRLHQVVANLLANARTHTPPGTLVTAGVRVEGDEVVASVTDTGPGIPAELLPKVFERFVRADASRVRKQGQSTGLGLSIVAAVVQAHGGSVSVESVPGRTRFEVRLRRAVQD